MAPISSTGPLSDGFNVNLHAYIRPWLDLIDSLRDIGIAVDEISLPQIVVMGDQSSGKSSVLEALSGIEFPRGSGIVTRCPTEVKLKRSPNWSGSIKLSGDGATETLQSPVAISQRIQTLTQELTKSEKDIQTHRSIQIEVCSPDVSDLTVIDLPGIVRWRMTGQSESVVREVDALLQRYLTQPRTVILAVIPSNVDIATVDIIERARQVDPEFKRTIGVFTKPDLMDSGHLKEKTQILLGDEASIKLSCSMVRNRGPNGAHVSLAEAKQLEATYFQDHAVFQTMDPTLFGLDHFSKKLSLFLAERIKEAMPGVKNDIMRKLEETTEALRTLGDGPPRDPKTRASILSGLLQRVTEDICNSAKGVYTSELLCTEGRARMFDLSYTLVSNYKLPAWYLKPRWEVKSLIKFLAALRHSEPNAFTSYTAFPLCIQEVLEILIHAVCKLLESMSTAITQACHSIISHYTKDYPSLEAELKKIVDGVVSTRCKGAKANIKFGELFDSELQATTINPSTFMKLQHAVRKSKQIVEFENYLSNSLMEYLDASVTNNRDAILNKYRCTFGLGCEEQQEAEVLKAMLEAYSEMKVSPFIDKAAHTVYQCLLYGLQNEIGKECYTLARPDMDFKDYFDEPLHISQRRTQLENAYHRLTRAKNELSRMTLVGC